MLRFLYEGSVGQLLAPLRSDADALEDAIYAGNSGRFEELVAKGVDLSRVNPGGNNYLHQACYHGRLDMVMRLLELGASVHPRGTQGQGVSTGRVAQGSTCGSPDGTGTRRCTLRPGTGPLPW